jgi:hypothetical protein
VALCGVIPLLAYATKAHFFLGHEMVMANKHGDHHHGLLTTSTTARPLSALSSRN